MEPGRRPDLPPGTEVDGLVVESFLGAGGQGTVYRARNPETGHVSALKFVPFKEARGPREFAILTRLRHLNLVMLEGMGFWPLGKREYLCLRLAFIPGKPLDVWARELNPDAYEAAAKVLGVGRGLAVAHRFQVVHRDVKENNILVRLGDGEAVLVDFGAGSYVDATPLTQSLFPPGTRDYRSPEDWRFAKEHGQEPGARYRPGPADDLYALGVVLYWLLTHRHPFQVTEDGDPVRAVIEQLPLPPHVANPKVPRAVSLACMKLLEKRPEDRYPSAVALCEELERLMEGADASWRVPLQGGPRSPPKWPRLTRYVGPGLGLVLGVLVLLNPPREVTRGREVAPSTPSPEAVRTAAPPPVEDTPAVVASHAAPAKDDASVKKPSVKKPQKKTLEARVPAACAGLLGAVLQACIAAQQQVPPAPHPGPPPQECPPEVVKLMRGKLGFAINQKFTAVVDERPVQEPRTVREGETTFYIQKQGILPSGTEISGRLYITETRVYGRFTQARTPTGEIHPVCLELREGDESGSSLEAGSTPDNVLIHFVESVAAVERFE